MDDCILKLVVVAVVSWTAAFLFIRKIFPNHSFDFCNHLVSTIHATLAVTLTSLFVQDWRCSVCPLTSNSSPRQSGSELVAALFITKIYSPFLHCREMLKKLGYRDTGLNLIADVTFAAIFTFARMVCGLYLTYLMLSARNPIIIKIYLLVWFRMLLGMWLELECYWKMVGCWVWAEVLLSVCIGMLECGCWSSPTGRGHYCWKSSLKSCCWNISINL